MAIDLTPEQRETGKENFARTADGLTRRGFMKGLVAGGAAVAAVSPAVYFGYQALHGRPVKAALIGGGDEGGVLVGEHNPEFLEFIAVTDIRPSNMKRIFEGEAPPSPRKGFNKVYGADAKNIRKYTDYMEMLQKEPDIEAVVIALPLHLHAKAAIDAMRFGHSRSGNKPIHVLTEKLMAWDIGLCKKMIEVAEQTGSLLAVGHQRHYSMLYAHATEVMNSGVLGEVKHIRALWHRNNSWPYQPSDKDKERLAKNVEQPFYKDGWFPPIFQEDYDAVADKVKQYGYDTIDELVRWRTYHETGGGLMAELGSHQMDACSIFLGHVHPLAVTAVGGKYFYRKGRNDRQCEDAVFVTYEFPGKDHPKGPARPDGTRGNDESDVVVVTYSSVNTNGFESYGECVTGSRGTMIVEMEQSVMLYPEKDPNSKAAGPARALTATVDAAAKGKPALEASSTVGGAAAAAPAAGPAVAGTGGPVSKGYKEEMEDFAYCIRLLQGGKASYEKDSGGQYKTRLPRCHGEVAMADAIIALTANQAMKKRERIPFKDDWFDPKAGDVPDGDSKPKIDIE
jgi:predicted dehydrogenase